MHRTMVIGAALAMAAPAVEAQSAGQRPDRAMMRQVMVDLGVGRNDMRTCFGQLNRANASEPPSDTERAEIREELYGCLKSANPALTEAQFQSAMSRIAARK
ncbi:MAG: hypothetical protein QNJ16_14285 [Rhodobacter sp.]|nr:hypothetical protein [Rhodobacter sp.]